MEFGGCRLDAAGERDVFWYEKNLSDSPETARPTISEILLRITNASLAVDEPLHLHWDDVASPVFSARIT